MSSGTTADKTTANANPDFVAFMKQIFGCGSKKQQNALTYSPPSSPDTLEIVGPLEVADERFVVPDNEVKVHKSNGDLTERARKVSPPKLSANYIVKGHFETLQQPSPVFIDQHGRTKSIVSPGSKKVLSVIDTAEVHRSKRSKTGDRSKTRVIVKEWPLRDLGTSKSLAKAGAPLKRPHRVHPKGRGLIASTFAISSSDDEVEYSGHKSKRINPRLLKQEPPSESEPRLHRYQNQPITRSKGDFRVSSVTLTLNRVFQDQFFSSPGNIFQLTPREMLKFNRKALLTMAISNGRFLQTILVWCDLTWLFMFRDKF